MQDQPIRVAADDVAVTLAVRQELGAAHEPAVIAEFLDRVGGAIDERVDARLSQRQEQVRPGRSLHLLPVASLVLGIPTTAIAAEQGLGGILVCWAGIAAVNVADALRR
jgi:hypothetical protein